MVQKFVESVKLFSYYSDKHNNTGSLKRGKDKNNKQYVLYGEREREESD
jgi:hypothetical protein